MKNHTNYGYVPWVDTQAGSCLTALNWQEVGVSAMAYSLEALLIKPGLSVLNQFSNLAHFVSWTGGIVLDARMPVVNKEGLYKLQSPFDGSKISLSPKALIAAIAHLSPDDVLLPAGIDRLYPEVWEDLPDKIHVFLCDEDSQNKASGKPCGVYRLSKDEHQGLSGLSLEFNQQQRAFLSDSPSNEAYQGLLYTSEGNIDLKQPSMAMQFEPIDKGCVCPVCRQGFTRAYLHHLLEHTPLLCHRLLIQHNVYFIQ